MKYSKRAIVEFFDITADCDSWHNEEAIENAQPILVSAEGFIVYEDDTLLKLSPMVSIADGRAGILVVIPKGCIVTRQDF